MKSLYENEEFTYAAMCAWNKLTTLCDGKGSKLFDSTAEFKHFYELIVEKLYEEGE